MKIKLRTIKIFLNRNSIQLIVVGRNLVEYRTICKILGTKINQFKFLQFLEIIITLVERINIKLMS